MEEPYEEDYEEPAEEDFIKGVEEAEDREYDEEFGDSDEDMPQ